MNKQTLILICMLNGLIFASIVLISKSAQIKMQAQEQTLTQRINELQSGIIRLSSAFEDAPISAPPQQPADYFGGILDDVNQKLARHENLITRLYQDFETTLVQLGRIDSAHALTNNEAAIDGSTPQPGISPHARLSDKQANAKQALFQAERYAEFQSEQVDPVWSGNTRNQLISLFQNNNDLAGASLSVSQCRRYSCEIGLDIDNNLDEFAKFELENNILIELARMGLDSAAGMKHASGATTMIVRSSQREHAQQQSSGDRS